MTTAGAYYLDPGTLNAPVNTSLLHESSRITQGTEVRLSSMRSRALSSLLSTSTVNAPTAAEVATARGPWALFCFRVRDSALSRALLVLIVLLDSICVTLDATNMSTPALMWTSHIFLLLGSTGLVITGVGSQGLWSSRQAYFRSWTGWLDTGLLLNIAADIMLQLGALFGWWTHTPAALAVLAVLRNMRSWALLRVSRRFRSAIGTLTRSANDLAAVFIFVLAFLVLVLIVLLRFYGFAGWYRCYPNLPLPAEVQASDSCSADSFFWDVDESQFRFCSDRSRCKAGTSCRNLFLYSVTSSCSAEERKRLQDRAWFELQNNEEAAFGVLGFQTIRAAVLTILQGLTLEGWAITMQRHVDADHFSYGFVAYILFPAVVVIGGMLLMNLAIAVLWEAFDTANAHQISRPAILREAEWRVYQLLGADWIRYLMVQLTENWDSVKNLKNLSPLTEEDANDEAVDKSATGKNQSLSRRLCLLARKIDKEAELRFPELRSRLYYFFEGLSSFAFQIATNRFTPPLMLSVVAVDVTFLLLESGSSSGTGLPIVYIATSVIFVSEAIILLLAFGRRGMRDGFICLDIVTACFSIVDGLFAMSMCTSLIGCRRELVDSEGVRGTIGAVFSMLRPFRSLKLVKYFPNLRITAEMLWRLHNMLFQYLCLLFYTTAVVAQLGLLLFFDSKYISLHAEGIDLSVTKFFNFETPGNAILLLLAILTGEGWDLFFRDFLQVYGRDLDKFSFDTSRLSGLVLSASFRLPAINGFLFFSLLFLNCLIFNLYGAIMIGHLIQTQKDFTLKHAAKFIATCRNAGIAMPAEDALQGQNAQALYSRVDMTTDAQRDELIKSIVFGSDRQKSAKALGEFARKTSLALDICRTVARKSSRRFSRASSGSISWGVDSHRNRSNSDIPLLSKAHRSHELMNDTDFDRAIAERGLRHLVDPDAANSNIEEHNGGCSASKFNRKIGVSASRNSNKFDSSQSFDDPSNRFVVTRAAVQFVEGEQKVPPREARPRFEPLQAAKRNAPYEELQFKELFIMFWGAIRDALRQGRVAVTAKACVVFSKITPTDPDSLALQLAYVGHLMSDAYEMTGRRPLRFDQANSQQSEIPAIGSFADLRNRSGSSTSITCRRQSVGRDMQQRRSVHWLPMWMQILAAKQREAYTHLRNVCGIDGIVWIQLSLQLLSLVELIIECSLKAHLAPLKALGYIELGFQVALTAELLLRFALSFTSAGVPFFTSRSNCWDLLLQSVAWFSFAFSFTSSKKPLEGILLKDYSYRITQSTRVLRCIWLLRLWRGTGIHRLVLALNFAIRRILDLGLIFVLLVTLFAVDLRYLLESVAGDAPAIPLPHANVTSLGESFLSVLILTTSESWPRLLGYFLGLDDRHRTLTVIICGAVVAFLSVFLLNLFVGIIVDVLDKEQANLEYCGGVRSATVLRWNEVQRAIFSSHKTTPMAERRKTMTRGERGGATDWLSHILTSRKIEAVVTVISLASCLSMLVAGAWAESSVRWYLPNFHIWIFWTNALIVVGYVIEQCLRISIFKKAIFQRSIYFLDFAITVFSLTGLVVALLTSLHTPFPAAPLWPMGLRMIRVAYIVCQRLPVMRIISVTMINLVGSLGKVLLLLAVLILIYGLLGTSLFYDAPIDPKLHSSFATLFDTFVLLMSCCTGENWHDIMLQARAFYYERDCTILGWMIVAYAVTFVAVAFLLLMNVFMSTVLKGYVDTKRNQSLWKVAQQHQDLLNKWKLREMRLSWLPVHVAVQVLTEVSPPIGFKNQFIEMGSRRMTAILASLAAYPPPVHKNLVHIRDVVLTTTCRACEAHAQRKQTLASVDPFQEQQRVELNPRLVSAWMNRFDDTVGISMEFNIVHYLAALQIQAFWRTRKLLQRNGTAEQLRFMKHLMFLLETCGPICARKAPRPDNRRSTLRRKRGTKAGGSFAHRGISMARAGTSDHSSKSPQQPKERLKSVVKHVNRISSVSSRHHENRSRWIGKGSQHRILPQEKDVLHQIGSQRRSTAGEFLAGAADTELSKINALQANPADEERSAQCDRMREPAFVHQVASEEASGVWKLTKSGVSSSKRDAALVPGASTAAARLSVAESGATSQVSASAREVTPHSENEDPFAAASPSVAYQSAARSPTRSSMKVPQQTSVPAPRRSSLRIVPPPNTNANHTVARDLPSDPPRRRGQSVQFTGVERLELQHLLEPALDMCDSKG